MGNPRRLLIAAAFIVIALASARLSCVQGIARRITIDGPSMAPALCGAHYEVTCLDCRFPFRIDADHPPPDGNAVCPNCGYGENQLAKAVLSPRQRVVLDRWPLLWGQLPPGEIIAARSPTDAAELVVKRVAAKSRDVISIEDGDLCINCEIVRKSLAELQAVRVLVHDNDFQPRPASKLPARWQATSADAKWVAFGHGFKLPASQSTEGNMNWLAYQHCPCTANQQLRGTIAPVRDLDSYNQGPGPRELNAVSDVLFTCHVRCNGSGQLGFAAQDGQQRFEVVLESGKDVRVLAGEQSTAINGKSINLSRRAGIDIEFGLCDRQVLLAIDGQTVVCWPYDRPPEASKETLQPLAIGANGLEVELTHLRVWRDIYYLDPQGLPRPWKMASPLLPTEIFLLGDNQPVSIDSRQWEPVRVNSRAILGKVYRPFWSPN